MLNLQIPIHIADGSLTKKNEKIISEFLKRNKRLKIDYKHYGKDIDLQAFYRKTTNAIESINSDYIIFTCNDDFLIEASINEGEKFLENNKDYVAAAGPVYDTTICQTKPEHDQIWGILSHPINQYPAFDRVENNALSRLQSFLKNRKSSYIWSALHKRKIFLKTCKDILNTNPVDLRFHTHSVILFTLARGKVSGSLPCMTIHQNNPSESEGKKIAKIGTWYDWIQTDNWFSSYEKMITKLTDIIFKDEQHKREILKRNIEFIYQGLIGELVLRISYPKYLHYLYNKGVPINKSDPIFSVFCKINEMVSNFQKKISIKRSMKSKFLMFTKKFILIKS